jgi:hypothetical protein
LQNQPEMVKKRQLLGVLPTPAPSARHICRGCP